VECRNRLVEIRAGSALSRRTNRRTGCRILFVSGLVKILESAGGAVGGYIGGILPDWIDPPFHPGHRSLAHGLAPVTTGAAFWYWTLDDWQNHLRQIADHHAQCRARSTDFASTAWHAFAEWVLRLLSGFPAGIGAGYIIHVAFDFATPRCLPVVC
jgi:hypothetical protein